MGLPPVGEHWDCFSTSLLFCWNLIDWYPYLIFVISFTQARFLEKNWFSYQIIILLEPNWYQGRISQISRKEYKRDCKKNYCYETVVSNAITFIWSTLIHINMCMIQIRLLSWMRSRANRWLSQKLFPKGILSPLFEYSSPFTSFQGILLPVQIFH